MNNAMMARETVRVAAPARLHLGFLDVPGGSRQRFGSIGVGITGFSTVVSVSRSERLHIHGADEDYIAGIVHTLLDYFHIDSGVRVEVEQHIPRHQGLGSGTQMALALGTALANLFDIDAGVDDIAVATRRGRRSGVGLGVFRQGGFILDSGTSAGSRLPTVIFRHAFPEAWRFVLVMDRRARGLSGADEVKTFQSLPAMDSAAGAEICRQVLMQMLPGLVEKDCRRFGASVTRIQASIGAYFSAAQGGRYASEGVGQTLTLLLEYNATGVGQTSWGPTGFAIFPDEKSAQRAIDALAGNDDRVSLLVAGAENNRARINRPGTADR